MNGCLWDGGECFGVLSYPSAGPGDMRALEPLAAQQCGMPESASAKALICREAKSLIDHAAWVGQFREEGGAGHCWGMSATAVVIGVGHNHSLGVAALGRLSAHGGACSSVILGGGSSVIMPHIISALPPHDFQQLLLYYGAAKTLVSSCGGQIVAAACAVRACALLQACWVLDVDSICAAWLFPSRWCVVVH